MALLLTRLYAPLTALATARLDVVTALVSFERVFEVLDIEPLIAEPADPHAVPDGPGVGRARRRALRLPVGRPGVAGLAGGGRRARRPAPASEVLHGVSFRVEPGPDGGAGRLRRAPASRRSPRSSPASTTSTPAPCALGGRRRARPVLRLDPASTVGVVTQDGHLFHDTIRANLRLRPPRRRPTTSCGTRCAAPASTTSCASLPDGLDTVVGERGYRLSGGERQRLTIARLLLAQPRVVILDEATAHLDSESEVAVQEALAAALDRPHGARHRPPPVDHPGRRR